LSLAQGNKVESVGFCGPRPERELQRKLNAANRTAAVVQALVKGEIKV